MKKKELALSYIQMVWNFHSIKFVIELYGLTYYKVRKALEKNEISLEDAEQVIFQQEYR